MTCTTLRALDLRRDARLAEEALDEPGSTRQVGVEDLDRDACAEPGVEGLVDRAHTPVAEETNESVLAAEDVTGLHARVSLASDASRCPRGRIVVAP